jgi:hypothetical protein
MTIVPVLQPGMKTEQCLPLGNLRFSTHHIIHTHSVYTTHYGVAVGSCASYSRVTVPNHGCFFQCHQVKDCTVIPYMAYNFSPEYPLFPTNYSTVGTVLLNQTRNKTICLRLHQTL